MSRAATTPDAEFLPLRERKKLHVRRALADAARRLFVEQGFDQTTLDQLVDSVDVSKRTFFRTFSSKEDVALAAELELWDAYVAALGAGEVEGPLLALLRETLVATLESLGEEWVERFIETRGVVAHHINRALYEHSELLSMRAQERVVAVLEERLEIDGRRDVRLRLLGELSLSAWRCGAKNWVAGRGMPRSVGRRRGGLVVLVRRIEEAFDAIPASLELSVEVDPTGQH